MVPYSKDGALSLSDQPRLRGFHVSFAPILKVAKDDLQVRCRNRVPSEAPKIKRITSDLSCDSVTEWEWVGNK